MFGEDKEICRGCGDEWYSKWYKDGFCHTCQNDGTHEEFLWQRHIAKVVGITIKVVTCGLIVLSLYLIFT